MLNLFDHFAFDWVEFDKRYAKKVCYQDGKGQLHYGTVTHTIPNPASHAAKKEMREIDARTFSLYCEAIEKENDTIQRKNLMMTARKRFPVLFKKRFDNA